MGSLDWIYPSVLAGAVRTTLGKITQATFFSKCTIDALRNISISGPLPLWRDRIFFPAPKDILIHEAKKDEAKPKERYAYALRPTKMKDGEGCDLPFSKDVIIPTLLPEKVQSEFKPAKIPVFWSEKKMIEWLMNPIGEGFDAPPELSKSEEIDANSEFLAAPQKDSRIHTKLNAKLGSAEDEMLFKTIGLNLDLKGHPQGIQLAVRIEADGTLLNGKSVEDITIDCFSTLGGERRLSYWSTKSLQKGWNFPEEKIYKALACQKGNKRIRMALATPAIFSQGWIPGWLKLSDSSLGKPSLVGMPEGAPAGLKLKLVSACTDRWKPISGWNLEKGKKGPKPLRRLVPAGSVYFFEVLEGDEKALVKNLWLRSVCDKRQDRLDGFGLVLWGVWDYFNNER